MIIAFKALRDYVISDSRSSDLITSTPLSVRRQSPLKRPSDSIDFKWVRFFRFQVRISDNTGIVSDMFRVANEF